MSAAQQDTYGNQSWGSSPWGGAQPGGWNSRGAALGCALGATVLASGGYGPAGRHCIHGVGFSLLVASRSGHPVLYGRERSHGML